MPIQETNDSSPNVQADQIDDGDPLVSFRCITSIQVRNLTPFPARDSLASVLLQSHTTTASSSGLALDDADIAISRRRSRRISVSSIHTLKSVHSDQDNERAPSPISSPLRNRANSRANLHAAGESSTGTQWNGTYGTAGPSTRSRNRTISSPTLSEEPTTSNLTASTLDTSDAMSSPSWFTDSLSSQKQLEEVIWSRLVETFLTVDDMHSNEEFSASATSNPPMAIASQSTPLTRKSKVEIPLPLKVSGHNVQAATVSSQQDNPKARTRTSPPATPSLPLNGLATHQSPKKKPIFHSPPSTPTCSTTYDSPCFISPFHRPSTNPKFTIDPDNAHFSHLLGPTKATVVVRLWGNVGSEWGLLPDPKGKGKAKASEKDYEVSGWKVIAEWHFGLNDLAPLPNDIVDGSWSLPANTLVFSFASSDHKYFLPDPMLGGISCLSPTQLPDYSSDSEIALRGEAARKVKVAPDRGRQRVSRKGIKSANVNELHNLVTLQASVVDAENHLDDALSSCNQLLETDRERILRREYSQGEYRVQRVQEQRDDTDDQIKLMREDIEVRRNTLRQRRMHLEEARILDEEGRLFEADIGILVSEEKKRVQCIRTQIAPAQASLLSMLSFIFPIELLSPPDLLYTILGVPLPIPLQGNDPAPPLSLLGPHSSLVNEDSVATALGYAALVVQLTAAYLCQRLLYPITYVGSRSLVKDPISAMVGPRMFPLYTKAVDTYRFEYAVFLLNKDIELLMAERNLRALDLRHTLPNLKNLLLTITSSEIAKLRPRPSTISINSGLQSPPAQKSEDDAEVPHLVLDASMTPKVDHVRLPNGTQITAINADTLSDSESADACSKQSNPNDETISASSSASTLRPRMPRLQIQNYLGFSPLTSMWRGKQPAISTELEIDGNAEPDPSTTLDDVSATIDSKPMTEGEITRGRERSTAKGEVTATHADLDFESSSCSELSDGSEGSNEVSLSLSTPPTSAFSPSNSDRIGDEAEDEEDEDDEDDRRTLRGQSTPTTPTAERPESVFGSSMLNTLKARVQRRQSNSHMNGSTNGDIERERKLKKSSLEKDTSVEKRLKIGSKSKSREREEVKMADGVGMLRDRLVK